MIVAIRNCLHDHTIDRRGDIGSKVRIQAIKAVEVMAKRKMLDRSADHTSLVTAIVGLAVEKLDKVRHQAFSCLQQASDIVHAFPGVPFPS